MSSEQDDKMHTYTGQAFARMPSDNDSAKVLEERARLLRSERHDGLAEQKVEECYLRISLGEDARYGIPFDALEEILYTKGVRSIPGVPNHIAGVINRRGEFVTVVDPAPLFGLEPQTQHADSRIIVVQHDQQRVAGLLVSRVESEVRYMRDELTAPFPTRNLSTDFIRGIHLGSVTLLAPRSLLASPEVQINHLNHSEDAIHG
ncbi:chemotaxis protein CheW [Magnetococcus sp. PR-3]|uniref:chemotaxis protein CheW n=1 Tax=Magnetococcus sp. PR-3 TaxID=3120355 RepID=UPI002FCE5A69